MTTANAYSTTLPTPAAPPADAGSTFYFDGEAIRVIDRAGEPWFAAGDVARAIGHRDAYSLTRLLKDDHKGTHHVCTPGGTQAVSVISEAGLYRSILLRQTGGLKLSPSTRARIERFQGWVDGEVLPSIRRTGGYTPAVAQVAPAPVAIDVRDPKQISVIALQLLQLTQEQAREISDLRVDLSVAETRIEMDRPKIEAFNAFLDDEGLCTLQSAARAIDAPQTDFFDWLRKRGWLVDQEGWTQPGWERRRDRHFVVRHREVGGVIRSRTHVTRGGLVWLRDRWQAKLMTDARDAERARLQGDLGL
ncbi:phage antirepressor KilAC domain-containing protein [Methylorubrum extorquens]|uniref:phage antirepressor n=1 Tax=Methylorubrum extorquens TaxID=408 RepID=UPI0022388046|nr:phage antirepressor KilAC domain-containing protein [Methylorubrum extorquens]UYW28346.1 phage antirepressor KilAC domain-containing protein [Methylorubrum extorquens]